MKKIALFVGACLCSLLLQAQMYFPPLTGTAWDSLSPASLGWCQDQIDSLNQYLEDKNSRSFVILKDGKIAMESYYHGYTQDSFWYWASAGKSLVGFLVGMAQEQGYLDINDPTFQYLGPGWTSCTASQESLITIRNQISMTTGLNDQTLNGNCLADTCLEYLTDPDTRWAYYNAPYRLVQDVLDSAVGQSINLYTYNAIGSRIGMGGIWYDYVRYGSARDMARFGLMVLNKGIWDGDTLLADTAYYHDMLNTYSSLNPAYGYLWWLNGKSSYKLPGLQFNFPGSLIPNAPNDMVAALGKDDQKIYVVPSQNMVVVRQGEPANNSLLALSTFDDSLWIHINKLACATATPEPVVQEFGMYPNPARGQVRLSGLPRKMASVSVLNVQGQVVLEKPTFGDSQMVLDLQTLPAGMYFVRVVSDGRTATQKLVLY